MGFFSDLKEDLSQAVNELMPEEEMEAVKNEEKNVIQETMRQEEKPTIEKEAKIDRKSVV